MLRFNTLLERLALITLTLKVLLTTKVIKWDNSLIELFNKKL